MNSSKAAGPGDTPVRSPGRLMTADEISKQIFRGHVSAAWVRRNLPGKISPSHSRAFWWEREVYEQLNSQKEQKK